ncbi:MAG: hypothetical protein RIS70_4467 [Planctomycetota bacterium]
MKISDVHIGGFGVWTEMNVDHLAGDVTVFYGPNEAGKTTLMQFMRTVLYGFTKERRTRYLPPAHGGQAGGSVRVTSDRGTYEIHRRAGAHDLQDAPGEAVVTDAQGVVLAPQQLSSILGGLDETIFSNVFAIGLREMQELGTLNDSAAADQLYKLTSGLDRVSLIDVMRELGQARERILSADESASQLGQLLERQDRLGREIDDLAARGRRWPQLAAQRAAMVKEIEEVEVSVQQLQQQLQSFDLVLQVRDKWWQRRNVEEELVSLGPPVDVVPDAIEQLEQMNTRLKKLKRRAIATQKQAKSVKAERDRHVVNRSLLAQASRIQALTEHAPWIGSLETEVDRLRGEVAALERELEARRPQIDGTGTTPRHKLPDISAKSLALLRGPASKLNHLTKMVDRTQREAESVKMRTDQALQRVSTELADLDESSLAAALEKAGTRVAMLRRRIQIEERIDDLAAQQKSLEDQEHVLFDTQVMPFDRMAWQFAGFVFSSLLIFTGCFAGWIWGFDGWIGFFIAMLGFVLLGISVFSKLEWERESRMRLETCERQQDLLESQLQATKTEREELDAQLPTGGGPLDARLAQAEKHLLHLEQLTPLDAQRHESGQHVEAAERRAARVAEEVKEAKKAWQHALRSTNLPDNLMPNDVRQLVKGFRQMTTVRRQLDQRREELESRQRELASLAGRIQGLLAEVGMSADLESPQAQLKQLSISLSEQQQAQQRRDAIAQQFRKLHARGQALRRRYDSVLRARTSLLARANARDEEELRRMITRQQQIAALRSQRELLSQEIRLVVGDQWSEESLARELLNHEEDPPEKRRHRLQARLQDTRHKVAQLHERRGQLAAEMKTLADDRRLLEAKLESGCVQKQIQKAAQRWQLLAVTSLILESVRGTYETTRQPETLREASAYLEQLTAGQYVRIWTPIEEKALRVDDREGNTLMLEKLSRGTREAVFLGLRLALAAGYARRGIVLPLILDDVLVNFDTARVRSAARLLREFANRGHQLLFFTCHEHVMRIFRSENADIRILPGRTASGSIESLRDESPATVQRNESPAVVSIAVPTLAAFSRAADIAIAEPPKAVVDPKPRRRRSTPSARAAAETTPIVAWTGETTMPRVFLQPASTMERSIVAEPIVVTQRVEMPATPSDTISTESVRVIDDDATDRRMAAEKRVTWESPEMYTERGGREAVA